MLRSHSLMRAMSRVMPVYPAYMCAQWLSTAAASSATDGSAKLWGGRFTGKVDPLMEEFNNSLRFDQRLWRHDIQGSIAYAKALAKAGIITHQEGATLVEGLEMVKKEWESGTFKTVPADEDIHTANERRLTELVGSVGGKLHTGRSRNDQVATDVRLWLRDELDILQKELDQLISVAATRAKEEVDFIMPGYTHLQPAQPVRWSHWMLSHAWAWKRDSERLADVRKRVNLMPLGSGAIAGHAFRIDRHALATDLSFDGPCPNSMDAVSDRDFIVETLQWAALLSVHLSRWAEDLIIYSSREFGFVSLSDAYSTGSSLMPQKKNPDALELLRGKSGRTVGAATNLLFVLKGLPSTYNKDLQEDKEPLFDTVDTLRKTIPIALGVLSTLKPNRETMRSAIVPEMMTTDLADYLVRKGIPFRSSHHAAGAVVRAAENSGRSVAMLSAEELKGIDARFEPDVLKVWEPESSVEARDSYGGTSRRAVLEQAAQLEAWVRREKS